MSRLSLPGLVVLVLGLAGAARAATTLMADINFSCPENQIISSISSVYDNATKDRSWHFVCRAMPQRSGRRIGGIVNNFRSNGSYVCFPESVLSGIDAFYASSYKDRIYIAQCLYPQVNSINCTWTDELNVFGGNLSYTAPADKLITGISSHYSMSSMDRIWRFRECVEEPFPTSLNSTSG